MKRRDQMDSEVQANSKMLVSGNHAAKADHFTKVKKELLKSQENERKLMEQLRVYQKGDQNLKKKSENKQPFANASNRK